MSQLVADDNLKSGQTGLATLLTRSHNLLKGESFEKCYRNICSLLLSLTHSRSLVKGLQLHAQVYKFGLQTIPLLSHHLINFYSKCERPYDCLTLFDEVPQKSSTTWSSLISSFAQNELPLQAIHFFQRMLRTGATPDDHIYPCATKSCAALERCNVGQSIHSLAMKSGFHNDVFVGSSMLDMYAKCGDLVCARKLFDEMPHRNIVSWSGMIYGYAQMGEAESALGLFKKSLLEDLGVNDFTLSCVIRVCGESTLFELGRQIQGLSLKTSFSSSSFVGSSIISLYSKCGCIGAASCVFDSMTVKNLGMWNAMLIAYAQHGHVDKAFELFRNMEIAQVKPNFITFLCLLYACSHSGLVSEGRYYFDLMKRSGIAPSPQHYASMVDLLGRAGKFEDALSIIDEMPMKPTECVWGALLTGCRIHGNTELAAFASDKVLELGPVSPGIHVLLSNAYAASGRLEDAAQARKLLRDFGRKKETGLSWIEEGTRVHSFVSGDTTHPMSKEIRRKLEELGHEMERAGYVADTRFVLQVVDGEEKNLAIRLHSERLAIAFGMIRFPPERPIRVMKNLRVCGDCHTAIKFMSKCTQRTIILRDNTRFHHFECGKCSCNDYW